MRRVQVNGKGVGRHCGWCHQRRRRAAIAVHVVVPVVPVSVLLQQHRGAVLRPAAQAVDFADADVLGLLRVVPLDVLQRRHFERLDRVQRFPGGGIALPLTDPPRLGRDMTHAGKCKGGIRVGGRHVVRQHLFEVARVEPHPIGAPVDAHGDLEHLEEVQVQAAAVGRIHVQKCTQRGALEDVHVLRAAVDVASKEVEDLLQQVLAQVADLGHARPQFHQDQRAYQPPDGEVRVRGDQVRTCVRCQLGLAADAREEQGVLRQVVRPHGGPIAFEQLLLLPRKGGHHVVLVVLGTPHQRADESFFYHAALQDASAQPKRFLNFRRLTYAYREAHRPNHLADAPTPPRLLDFGGLDVDVDRPEQPQHAAGEVTPTRARDDRLLHTPVRVVQFPCPLPPHPTAVRALNLQRCRVRQHAAVAPFPVTHNVAPPHLGDLP